ncbi:energy transducer TonB [Chryseobacterium sp. 3008163]|uniref:energy transducer TonB n=1 Tax=Chryseobacterium sp. 3008163 TaxID=2478663 RepID=UPI000F0C50FE|nr:energy transducer TonB [Chryseobacterium sp. 3008163]AYN01754.1 energy transducer TonB [Chryseobacterium sp. 3008163]
MKHLLENQEFRLNEILFENRNKQYGAYVLRNESDRILTKSLFIGVSLLAAMSITPMIISAFRTAEVIPNEDIYELPPPIMIPNDPTVKPPVTVVPPQTAPAQVKTFDDRIPEPTANPTNEQVIEKIEGAVAGVKNNPDGIVAPPNIHVAPPTIGTGPVINNVQPPTIEVVKDKNIIEIAAIPADFEGGIDSFRNKVINKFDTSAFEEQNSVATVVTFIVETNGTISDIKTNGKDASFNAEAIRSIKAVKGKWIPGKNKKGEAVRSYFKFPISMKFDN